MDQIKKYQMQETKTRTTPKFKYKNVIFNLNVFNGS